MSRFALRLKGVEKRYGKTRALDGLTLDVPRGALMGLVGPNGAGKTTTFGVVSGAVRPDAGHVDVLGEGPFDPARHAGRMTVLPQDCALNPSSSARQILAFQARLQGLTAKAAAREADRVLELVRLSDRAGSRVSQLSHGMKRRLAVAQALLGDPELVLLDEPTGGLDPHLVVAMREILGAQRGQRTVVVSSHILADLEATCDHVAFMEDGRCQKSGPVEEVTRRGALVRIQLAEPMRLEQLAAILDGRDPELEGDVLRYHLSPGEDPAEVQRALLPALIEAGAGVLEVRLGESLEAAYMSSRSRRDDR
ncbi:MAG: ABC transporter ATP-binding protein [Myxococcota bacterium]|nr:ABC transporter ATP-binding protein [Myxococcota bacterium]